MAGRKKGGSGKQLSSREIHTFIVENNATQQEAADFFGVSNATISRRLQQIPVRDWHEYKKIKKGFYHEIELETIEMANYIIENEATNKEAGEYFGLTESGIAYRIRGVRKSDPLLFKEVQKIYKRNLKKANVRNFRPETLEKVMSMANFLKENPSDYHAIMEKFEIKNISTIYYYFKVLRIVDKALHDEIKEFGLFVRKMPKRGSSLRI